MRERNKILVIEDDYKIKEIVVTILEEEDFEVFSCSDGKSGVKLAKNLQPLVIICDIMLPDIDGYEVCDEIRKSKETANSIFIFLTAKTDMQDLRKGMSHGADDYITKPFKASELIDAVTVRIQKHNSLLTQEVEESGSSLSADNNIFIPLKNETKIIKVSSIAAISAEGVYTNIYTSSGEKYLFRKSVTEWEEALPKNIFFRTHRSYIINQEMIDKIEPWYKHSFLVKVKNVDEDFFISERYATKLRKKFSF